jgi:hypothetical protein
LEGSYAVVKILEDYGLTSQILFGRPVNGSFTNDVFIQVEIGGKVRRLSLVPSVDPMDAQMDPEGVEWLDHLTVQKLVELRSTRIGLSHLRPMAVRRLSDQEILFRFLGIQREGRRVIVTALTRRVSNDQVRDEAAARVTVPLDWMQPDEEGRTELQQALGRITADGFEGALRRLGADVEPIRGQMDTETAELLRASLLVPVDPTPMVPEQERMESVDRIRSYEPAGFTRWMIEALSSASVVVIPDRIVEDGILRRRGLDRREVVAALNALPAPLAGRVHLLGEGWSQYGIENRAIRMVENPQQLTALLADELPADRQEVDVRILGVRPDDPLIGQLKGSFSRLDRLQVLVMDQPIRGRLLEHFLEALGMALGVPKQVFEEELDGMLERFTELAVGA